MALPKHLPNSPKPFKNRPSPRWVEGFKEHVRRTGLPEAFPGISWEPLEEIYGAQILTEFEIVRAKRPNLDMAPCPICSPAAPKFLKGVLIWVPSIGKVCAIGCECGAKIHEDWNAEKKRRAQEKKGEIIESFLEENLHRIEEIQKNLRYARRIAKDHRSCWSSFRKECPMITYELREAMKRGPIFVTERISSNQEALRSLGLKQPKMINRQIGSVTGQAVVKSRFEHHKENFALENQLEAIKFGSNQQECFLKICEMTYKEKQMTERLIKKARQEISKISDLNKDFISFFEPENLRKLNEWSQHENRATPFRIDYRLGQGRMKVSGRGIPTTFVDMSGLCSTHQSPP
ncbi:hypothetical protein [Anianabacter salinae]|uniref:hypothetical protein n=1 Tax=Anianabacter salinae TaxID=2851023 RepID=UPI00225E68BE|nr:hypothetical protein [Anianabacter salinae]MBV0912559.1 hypothetical protein [Anianabacter salinae]